MARGLQPRSAVKPARPGQTSERSRAACWKAGLAALALLTLAVRALAQTAAEPPSGQDPTLAQQAPATQQPAPTTPVPLFPRHRRGLYKNGLGLWVLDATPQSPPLDTDDPSVPDKGAYEINLTTDTDASRLTKKFDLLSIDANYGMVPSILGHDLPTQLKLEVPISAARNGDDPYSTGLGEGQFGLKFNFYENERVGIGMSFYPQVEFATGPGAVANGLADRGQTLVVPLLVSKDLKYLTLVVNAAVNTPVHDPSRSTTATLSAGVGLPVTRKLAVMAEVHSDSSVDLAHDRVLMVNVGLMRAVGQATVLYANVGHTLFSYDTVAHTYAGAGLKLLIKPDAAGPR